MGSRVADLMQAKAALLSSAAEARLQTVKQQHSDKLQHLKLEVADKECQVCPSVLPSVVLAHVRWTLWRAACELACTERLLA